MKKTHDHLQLSATDLSKFLGCTYATRLDKDVAEGKRAKPEFKDAHYYTVEQLGLEHEKRFIDILKAQGLRVTELRDDETEGDTHIERTLNAMHEGYDIIVQAAFASGQWFGKPDVLRKIPKPSALGDWSYEVIDTKLGQETKAGAVLQLCVYSEMLGAIQGFVPESMYIVKPGEPYIEERLRYDDYGAYYRWIRSKMERSLTKEEMLGLYPDPVNACDACRWWSECDQRRRKDDHLTFVAGLHASHAKSLQGQGISNLQSFAELDTIQKPSKGSLETLQKLQLQAKIQLKQRETKQEQFEYLAAQPGEGLARLPQPDTGDIFFDIEGDHFFPGGGIEYLLGITFQEAGEWKYQPYWGFNRQDEKKSFAALMEFILTRRVQNPDLHIYHFSPYEPNALKHLMLRHSIYGEELDNLLRGGRFIDLHQVLKESMRAGVEKYGLKQMEPFYAFTRETDLLKAGKSLRNVQRALELGFVSGIKQPDLEVIAEYNREDCISTQRLRDWLEERRTECIDRGVSIERPLPASEEAQETTKERELLIREKADALRNMLPEDNSQWNETHKAIDLLVNLLDYVRREEKSGSWEGFRINELEPDELLDERKAVYGLQFVGQVQSEVKSKKETLPIHQYRYPPQEFSGDPDDPLIEISALETGRRKIGTIVRHDVKERTIDIKKRGDSKDIHPLSVQINDFISALVIEKALLSFADNVVEIGLEGNGKFQAGLDLLFRKDPRFNDGKIEITGKGDITAKAITLSSTLNQSVLAIQGPPGTGKTYNGAHIICALQKEGKRIGVTAVSHKVIDNLLGWALKIASENEQHILVAHCDKDQPKERHSDIETIPSAKGGEKLKAGYIVGATAFAWARDEMEEQLDYLIIDEAGQMSLAYALAISRCAKNIILLGDPQQLDQPQKAAHPEGADVSALQHYIGEHPVIESAQGLFLDQTWRLHPGICAFTSQTYYEGKLHAREGLEHQLIHGNPTFGSQPLVHFPVQHTGNSSFAEEEIHAIEGIVSQLLTPGSEWTDISPKGTFRRPFTQDDIMIIAPYNAQVAGLMRRLPGMKIGTVDKFQGQEAAVVIYSMTSSSAEDAPRGMSFLYRPNRLNVASSRAKCLFILVASPKLLEPECKTPEQMKMANGLCLFLEDAIRLSPLAIR